MISIIWSLLTNNPIARLIGKIVGLALLVLSFGAWQRRQGAQGAKAKQAEAGLKATTKGNAAARQGKADAVEKLKHGQSPEDIVRGNDDAWR